MSTISSTTKRIRRSALSIRNGRYLPFAPKTAISLLALVVLALALGACATPAANASIATATTAPVATTAPAPTAAPTTAAAQAAPAAGKAAKVMVAKNDKLGPILTDAEGKTLYLFTKDSKGATTCYDQCAQNWPPLLTAGAPAAGDGADASLLGTTQRTDGTTQVTYNGMPLYYFIKDQKAGDTTGEGVGSVWFVVSDKGDQVAAASPAATPAAAQAAPAAGKAAKVMLAKNDKLGSILTDAEGKTLYLFTKDSKGATTCYDQCAQNWPPLLTAGAPEAGDGADASLLGTTQRTDGTTQVTYNGMPLYYFIKDQKAGDTTGQDVGGVWYVLSAKGDKLEAAKVMVTKNDKLGPILTDDEGKTLYLFTKDSKGATTCYDKCAQNWPPLLTAGAPEAGDGADASLLGTTQRTDGTTQVTYNGMPLYYFVKDQQAGDTTGQGVGEVWFVLSGKGDKVATAN